MKRPCMKAAVILGAAAFLFTSGFARAEDHAAGTAGYLKSATYYSDDWVINFWNSESGNMDQELARIAQDGFNNIILVVPWREFQPGMTPCTYNQYAWDKLEDAGIFKSSANRWTAAAYLGSVYNYLASCKRYDVGKELVGIQPLNDFGWVDEEAMSLAARDVLKEVVEKSPYELLDKNNYRKLYYEMSKEAQYKECLLMAEYAENTKHCMVSYYVLSPVGDAKTVGGSYQRMFPTMKLYRSYDNADVRRDCNITGAYNPNNRYGSDLSKIPSETVDGYRYYVPAESSGVASGTSTALWCTGKFRVSDPKERSSISANQCVMNYPLMRMAEVRLQYAEALYFTGDESGARKQFDPVRERVLAGDVSLKKLNEAYYRSDFVEELLEERGRELCYESKRKIDLIRFGRITETIEELPSEGGPNNVAVGIDLLKDNWRSYKIWLPVPQLEIDLNPNLEQNAVYAD